jgi:hypothetical protein
MVITLAQGAPKPSAKAILSLAVLDFPLTPISSRITLSFVRLESSLADILSMKMGGGVMRQT